jgi:L-asparaginase II
MVSVIDADGTPVMALGDVATPVFRARRSKPCRRCRWWNPGRRMPTASATRNWRWPAPPIPASPNTCRLAGDMAARAGLTEADFECGCHWSFEQKVLIDQARAGEMPDQLGNNCSGKHAGFLCLSCHAGVDHKGYAGYDHFVQATIRDVMGDLTGAALGHDNCGTDGCSIPTYAAPLNRIAHGFARMASGVDLGPERAKASRRLMSACMAEPFYVAGTRRACTELMQLAPGRIFAKTGAEGVFCAALPEKGYGIALKCEDGATRGAEAMIGAVLARLFADDEPLAAKLGNWSEKRLRNWNRIEVGLIRPVGDLA